MITVLYSIYIIFIFYPIFILLSIITALCAGIGCFIGSEHIFSYYPGMIWSRLTLALALIPVEVKGRENMPKDRCSIVVANHQSALDVYLLYGYMGVPFKWILRASLSSLPFVGWACRMCGFIFADNSTSEKANAVITDAKEALNKGYHIFIFPEGTRSRNGLLQKFKKGAFRIAMDTNTPIVPVTINGAFNILPKGRLLYKHGSLSLTINKPIELTDYEHSVKGIITLSNDVRESIQSSLHA